MNAIKLTEEEQKLWGEIKDHLNDPDKQCKNTDDGHELDPNWEEVIFLHFINDETFAKEIIPKIKINHFANNDYQTISSLVYNHLQQYGKLPSRGLLELMVKEKYGEDEKKAWKVLLAINDIKYHFPDRDALLNKYNQWYLEKQIFHLVGKAKEKNYSPEAYSEMLQSLRANSISKDLPSIENEFLDEIGDKPMEVVQGLCHKGSKLSLGGGSKTNKTWTLIHLAVAVASGSNWLGFKCNKGKVLYINFEIHKAFFRDRINAVRNVVSMEGKENIHVWNLRGYSTSYETIFPLIEQRIEKEHYDLVIIDPIYKLYGDADENKAGDITKLLNGLEAIAFNCNTMIAYGCHFAKGDSTKKSAIDRVSGSGVFARDPDAIINFTPHSEEDCYTVDAILRNFKPINPFVARWQFPVWKLEADLDPADCSSKVGIYSPGMLLDLLREPMANKEWMDAFGASKNTFTKYRNELIDAKKVIFDPNGKIYRKVNAGKDLGG